MSQKYPQTITCLARNRVLGLSLSIVLVCSTAVLANPELVFMDMADDAIARGTDPGGDGAIDTEAHHLPDLLDISAGIWTPDDPREDLFTGQYDPNGVFVRIVIELKGLANPPGSIETQDFNPYRFGPHPVMGFIEIDMDSDIETGGELDNPEYRYLGAVGRFGGAPKDLTNGGYIATSAADFDGDFESAPFVERSGEEFHISLLYKSFTTSGIGYRQGDTDLEFEADEIWDMQSTAFHRAHGYEGFSFAKGGATAGEYEPTCMAQFAHNSMANKTTISFVVPLTNEGDALIDDEPVQPNNQAVFDQTSIHEGLEDLVFSADFLSTFPTGLPEEELIIHWEGRNAANFLNPSGWSISALVGGSYLMPEAGGPFFVWSDSFPDVEIGDFDGNGAVDHGDIELLNTYIQINDAADGSVDGAATVQGFATDFSVFDLNYDGIVDNVDVELVFPPGGNVPAVSDWGFTILALLVLALGSVVFQKSLKPALSRACSTRKDMGK